MKISRLIVYNKIVTPEKLTKMDPENIQLGEDFLEYLQSVDRSPDTIKGYRNDLKIFWVWCLDFSRNKYFPELIKREVVKFQNYTLSIWDWGSSRVRHVRSCLSPFSNYIRNILDDEKELENYKPIIRKTGNSAKTAHREKTALADEQVDGPLGTLVECREYEYACAITVATYSGMCHGELLLVRPGFSNGNHFVYDSMWKTDKARAKGYGKDSLQLNKPVLYGVKPYIDLWMNEHKEKGINNEWMFVTTTVDGTKRIWKKGKDISLWVKQCIEILSVNFYSHSLHHYTYTKLHRMNLPTHVIQEFFGWASSGMLQIYNNFTAEGEFGEYFTKDSVKEVRQGSLTDT